MVGSDAVHMFGGGRNASKEVAAAHHESDLNAGSRHLGDLGRQGAYTVVTDAEGSPASQDLAAELEDDALVFRHSGRYYSAGGAVSAVSSICTASPTLKRTKRETEMFSPSLAIFALIRSATVVVFSLIKGCS